MGDNDLIVTDDSPHQRPFGKLDLGKGEVHEVGGVQCLSLDGLGMFSL